MVRRLAVGLVCLFSSFSVYSDDWPQWMGSKRDGIWRETGIIDRFPEKGPKIIWHTPIEGGYAGPAVTQGKVFVPDFSANGAVKKDNFARAKFKGKERLHCLEENTGKILWTAEYPCEYTVSYPSGPRCTPTVSGDKVYLLGTQGDLHCFEVKTGNVVWAKNFVKDYGAKVPLWGFSGHPLVYGNKVICIVGGKDSLAVAFDKDTGKELWKSLDAEEQGYSPPTLIEFAGKKQLIIWHGSSINSLNPDSGTLIWTVPLAPKYAMAIMAPRLSGKYIFAAGNEDVGALLELNEAGTSAKVVWTSKRSTSLHPINMTPFIEDGYIYGVDRPGPFRCVELKTGNRVWESTVPVTGKEEDNKGSGTTFVVKQGKQFFLFSETGHLIIANLTPKGYKEISRAKVIEPSNAAFGRDVVWSHPAFANRRIYIRNDKEIICVDVANEQ